MHAKMKLGLVGLALAALLFASPALAGGWSVVKLDHLPRSIAVGEPLALSYVVLQHGHNPVSGLDTRVDATHVESGESLSVDGRPLETVGRYGVELAFPQAGRWEWAIVAFEGSHPMPPLQVGAPAASGPVGGRSLNWRFLAAMSVIAFAGMVVMRKRPWVAGGIALAILGLGAAGSALGSTAQVVQAEPLYTLEADYGAALFVAKGCVGCHVHATNPYADKKDSYGFIGAYKTGPNLTDLRASVAYLAAWLRDPGSIKSQAAMPNLDLSDEEIVALIAFLNDK